MVRSPGPSKGFEFKYDYCKGCGVCVAECPSGAIEMVPANLHRHLRGDRRRRGEEHLVGDAARTDGSPAVCTDGRERVR